jgi:hypothetical protein
LIVPENEHSQTQLGTSHPKSANAKRPATPRPARIEPACLNSLNEVLSWLAERGDTQLVAPASVTDRDVAEVVHADITTW